MIHSSSKKNDKKKDYTIQDKNHCFKQLYIEKKMIEQTDIQVFVNALI